MYDFLIVGSGLFGATFANQAVKAGKKCLVIDKRSHIAGNCYTRSELGIDVHVYGPHIFHTSNKTIWNFVNENTEFHQTRFKPKVSYKDRIFSFPINLMTLHQLWGVSTPEEAEAKLAEVRIPCENPRNLEEWTLSQVGREIYETFIYGYTKKQWMREPRDLPASIIKRIPIRKTYNDDYFDDEYQGVPSGGYTAMFESMLDGCDVGLEEDFFKKRDYWERSAKNIVYTGKIDEYFNYDFGELEYRTLDFDHNVKSGDYQGCAVLNFTDEKIPHTRITEHKHFYSRRSEKIDKTVWTRETPSEWNRDKVPYYPIGDEKNLNIYRRYKEAADRTENVIFGGRLSEYKYYDMHQVIGSALHSSRFLLEKI